MASTMAWGESLEVLMELGNTITGQFKLNDATYGLLDGVGRLDGVLLADDVASYCKTIDISRGRSDQLSAFGSGSCNITLNNNDRRFDPINTSSPYWNGVTGTTGVAPRRKVTVKSNGVTLFVGRITDVNVDYDWSSPSSTSEKSTVQIQASDDFYTLATTITQADITPTEQLSSARVTAMLDLAEVNYPAASRSISTGISTVGGGATFLIDAGTNVIQYLQDVAQAEQGYFFVSSAGNLTFNSRVAGSFGSPEVTFTDTGSGVPYQTLGVMYGQELLYNKVICEVVGGTPQVANNTASQTEYGISTLSLTGLLLKDDAAALTLANALLSLFSTPQYRFNDLQTLYNGLSAGNQTALSSLDLTDIISVTRSFRTGTPSSITKNYRIQQVSHKIDVNRHSVEFNLMDAVLVNQFKLDDAVYGVLDSTNALV